MFATEKNINATFTTGFGEDLPYPDNSFDFIVSYDVFEHVRDLRIVMGEVSRVLKPGGRLLAVFPQFYQPLESHLTLVSKTPALHWIFSGQTLTDAYNEIIDERGEGTMHDVRSITTILKANVRASRNQTPQNTRMQKSIATHQTLRSKP